MNLHSRKHDQRINDNHRDGLRRGSGQIAATPEAVYPWALQRQQTRLHPDRRLSNCQPSLRYMLDVFVPLSPRTTGYVGNGAHLLSATTTS